MKSIRKKIFYMNVPSGLIKILIGVITLLKHNELKGPMPLFPGIIIIALVLLPMLTGYSYIFKNKNEFEPEDELVRYNETRTYSILGLFMEYTLSAILILTVFLKPQIEYWQLAAGTMIIMGLLNVMKYVVFMFLDILPAEVGE